MNLKEEVRNGYMVSSKMKKVWAVEIKLLKKLLEVCNKYNLKIVACGGSCIGAVREKGFIPWDDDIDMEMLRPDYDKLVKVAKKEFKYPYFFQCAQTEEHYFTGHAQLRMCNTTAIAKNDSRSINHGIPLDIFVLDAIPTSPAVLKQLKEKSLSLRKRLVEYSYFDYSFYYGSTFSSLFSWIYVKLIGHNKLSRKYEDLFRENSLDDATEVASMSFNWQQFERVRRSKHLMDDIIWMPFENTTIPVPAIYDEILRKHFGDYMKPVLGSSLHSGFDILDADMPYTHYLVSQRHRVRKESFVRKINKLLGRKIL